MAILFTAPKSAIELVLVLDVVELSWTIERYSLSLKVLMRSCEQAIKQCLRRTDPLEILSSARRQTRRNAGAVQ